MWYPPRPTPYAKTFAAFYCRASPEFLKQERTKVFALPPGRFLFVAEPVCTLLFHSAPGTFQNVTPRDAIADIERVEERISKKLENAEADDGYIELDPDASLEISRDLVRIFCAADDAKRGDHIRPLPHNAKVSMVFYKRSTH